MMSTLEATALLFSGVRVDRVNTAEPQDNACGEAVFYRPGPPADNIPRGGD